MNPCTFCNSSAKEIPILFSGEMVVALLNHTKTQTRRTRGLEYVNREPGAWTLRSFADNIAEFCHLETGEIVTVKCPFGRTGDRLWVRETWNVFDAMSDLNRDHNEAVWKQLRDGSLGIEKAADMLKHGGGATTYMYAADFGDRAHDVDSDLRWRPSIHMPRAASRITLERTTERAPERLQAITEDDANAEGITEPAPVHGEWCDPYLGRMGHWSYRKPFADLWNRVHGRDAWAVNPWVWPVAFCSAKGCACG